MFEIVVEKMISYLTYDMMFALCISVGPLYVDTSVPKMEDVEKRMSSAFSGWVDKGGRWKPTECKARVKVRCELQGSYRSGLENLDRPGILFWHFPGLESPGKRPLVPESSENLFNSTKKYEVYGRQ